MNINALQKIEELFKQKGVEYKLFSHDICRTSEESAKVRAAAGFPDAVGAKALLCKVDFKGGLPSEFVTFVLPGIHIMDKSKLKFHLPEIKFFRFCTAEELMNLAGVVSGCMPPFGKQVFEGISRLYISSELKKFPRVAFNAAHLNQSIILKSEDYFKTVEPNDVFEFSKPKEA
jgi:prolyl-tRNA editing enzyme YbaK/EbsC (Cys-tRNA(Pro) deacylase)